MDRTVHIRFTGFVSVLLAVIIAFGTFGTFGTVTAAAAGTIKVTASHSSGAYLRAFSMKLSAESDVALYYTLNGKKPTESSKPFPEKGLAITKDRTVRVLAERGGTKKYLRFTYRIVGTGNIDDKTKKYYYNFLRNKEKKVYNALLEAVTAQADEVKLYELNATNDEWAMAIDAFYWDNPDLKSVWDNEKSKFYSYSEVDRMADSILAYYTDSRKASKKRIAQLEAAAAEIAAAAKELPDDASKVRYVTDWLVYNTVYDDTDPETMYTAYGALVEHRAVCKGYSDAFTYLMQILGIPAMGFGVYINGDPNRYHAGNMVQIDGKWCNIDVTWTDNESDMFEFGYYLVGDRTFEKTHTKVIDGSDLIPPLPQGATNSYNKAAAAEDELRWSFRYAKTSASKAYIDTKSTYGNAPYSFRLTNEENDVTYIRRQFGTEPRTKYRFSAMCAYTGNGGVCIGEAFSYSCTELYSGNRWKRLTYEFTTADSQNSIELALYNGFWKNESSGSAYFTDLKLEKYESGKWVTVSADMAAGSGFTNIFDAMRPVSSLTIADIADRKYTGKRIRPKITITDGDYTLVKDIDYTVSYSGNKKPGTAAVTVVGKGIYTGTVKLSFEIVQV